MEKYIKKQLTESYNGELNRLFAEWKAFYPDEADADYFCEDGLVIKYKDENSGYDINEQWRKSPRKIMFLLKDCPDGWGYDARRLLVGCAGNEKSLENAADTRNVKGGFFKNIAKILYGLSYMTEENKGKELNDAALNKKKYTDAFNEIPFAYVECKKMAGGKTCSAGSLKSAISRDNEFLCREIDILKPNIIVCCDNSGSIFNNVVENYFKGLIPDEDSRWDYEYELEDGAKCGFRCKLYYYKEEGVLLFNSYHPSARAGWKIYEKVLSPFRQFFERYKTFDVVSGKSPDKDSRNPHFPKRSLSLL